MRARAVVPAVLALSFTMGCGDDERVGLGTVTGPPGTTGPDDDLDSSEDDEDEDEGEGDDGEKLDLGSADDGSDDDTGDPEPSGTCQSGEITASQSMAPVDIIVVVDTSSSMNPVSSSVEENLETGFANVLADNGADYQVIVLASRGDGVHLCIPAPLGSTPCDPAPADNVMTDTFVHYDRGTGSGAMLDNIVAWYSMPDAAGDSPEGWGAWLRPGARKVFLAFTDAEGMSNNPTQGDQFDATLLELDPQQFGTVKKRNYLFHTVSGLVANTPATDPWPAEVPLIHDECTGFSGKEPGEPLQRLSILTGGLRAPICEYQSFDAIFETVAQDLVSVLPIACSFALPEPPPGQSPDLTTVEAEYFPDGGATGELLQLETGPDACGLGGYYVDDAGDVTLCPATCDVLQADPAARVEIRYACEIDDPEDPNPAE